MLMDMKKKGLTDIDVANELGRSFESVAAKRKEINQKRDFKLEIQKDGKRSTTQRLKSWAFA